MTQQPTREELFLEYLPADDGKPPLETLRLAKAFAAKTYHLQLLDDFLQASYFAVITNIDRAVKVENPRGYIATAIRHALVSTLRDDSFVPYPYHASKVKKLPRPQRQPGIVDRETRTLTDAVTLLPDRPQLNGQLNEICETLSADESHLVRLLAEGLTHAEVAKALGTSRVSASTRIRRLRQKMALAMALGVSYRLAQEIINRDRQAAKKRLPRLA